MGVSMRDDAERRVIFCVIFASNRIIPASYVGENARVSKLDEKYSADPRWVCGKAFEGSFQSKAAGVAAPRPL
jgi:hypothetical protein